MPHGRVEVGRVVLLEVDLVVLGVEVELVVLGVDFVVTTVGCVIGVDDSGIFQEGNVFTYTSAVQNH